MECMSFSGEWRTDHVTSINREIEEREKQNTKLHYWTKIKTNVTCKFKYETKVIAGSIGVDLFHVLNKQTF